MFDSLKGMAGMAGLMRDLPKLKARMQRVKEDLNRITVTAETGGGAVRDFVQLVAGLCGQQSSRLHELLIEEPIERTVRFDVARSDRDQPESADATEERPQQPRANAGRAHGFRRVRA